MPRFVCALAVLSSVAGTTIEGASAPQATKQPDPATGLVFTRSVNTTHELKKGVAECVEADDGSTVVRLTSPVKYQKLFSQGRVSAPYFYVEATPGTEGRADLPLSGGGADAVPPVTVFGVDSADQNELTGSGERATGRVTILEATCDPEPALSFTIRATLDSESFDPPPVHVVGGLTATGSG